MFTIPRERLLVAAPLVVFALLLVLLVFRLGKSDSTLPSALLNQPLPEFKLHTLADEKKILTKKDLGKEPFLLTVWASWCLACKDEQALLLQLRDKHDLTIYGLNYKDKPGEARSWLRQFGDPFLTSIVDMDGELGIDLGVYGVPETYLVDGTGTIRYKHVGALTISAWKNDLLPVLSALRAEKG